jgi:hypothetical protein
MSDSTRKAVITTAQVQEALNTFTKTLATVSGQKVEPLEFDKGARGKGFAVYAEDGSVIDTFDTKEDAYVKYVNWVTVAEQVLSLIAARPAETPETESKPKATRKPAQTDAA